MSESKTHSYERALYKLWVNWTLAFAMAVLPQICSAFMPIFLMPVITFAAMGILMIYQHLYNRTDSASCMLTAWVTIRALAISGVIMIVITMLYSRRIIENWYESELLNYQIPYIPALIIAPVEFALAVWAWIRGNKSACCRNCRMLFGDAAERGFTGTLLSQESHYQLIFIMSTRGAIAVMGWLYYAYNYVNVNLNSNDTFIFCIIPLVFFLTSSIYFAIRYFTIFAYYSQSMRSSVHRHGESTLIRYLILHDDSIYLVRDSEFGENPNGQLADTPAAMAVSYREDMKLDEASSLFRRFTHLQEADYTIRFMYHTEMPGVDSNMYHYICSLENPKAMDDTTMSGGKWYNLSQLDRLLHNHELSPQLASEIHRLYTVVMAWKTYDSDGHRLYKVKNYRPLFRLKGIIDWEVDFDSPLWLNVARFNEDKPFYRLRRYWQRRFTAGK